MIWNEDISFEGFSKKINDWYTDKEFELCDPPIEAQYALDLIFKTLVDDKEHYPYLTTIPESTKQVNSIKLDLILRKYSRKYRKYLKKNKKKKSTEEIYCPDCARQKGLNWHVFERYNGMPHRYKCTCCGREYYENEDK